MASQAGRLDGFDLLRGLAALAVLGHHLRLPLGSDGLSWFGQGFLAVDMFFLLSGYVMARTYEPAFAGGLGAGQFMRVRLERLYPMLLLGGMLGVLLFPFYVADGITVPEQVDWPRALAGQFLLIPFLAGSGAFVFNNVQWSIVYELLANAVHALAWRSLTVRGLIAFAILSFLALVMIGLAGGTLSLGWARGSFLPGLARVAFGYVLGVALQRSAARWQPLLPVVPGWTLGLATLGILALPELPGTGVLPGLIQLASVALMVLIVMLASKARANRPIAQWLGEMSYPLYAVQTPLLAVLHWAVGHMDGGAESARLLALLAGSAAIAWLSGELGKRIERPLIDWRSTAPAQVEVRRARARSKAH